jgi:hypothetical protein
MGNTNSTQAVSNTINQITQPLLAQRIQNIDPLAAQSEIQDLAHDTPSPTHRYVQVLLEQGRLGKGLPEMVDRCVVEIRKGKPATEYIKVVFDHIFTKVQEGHMSEAHGASQIERIAREVRWQESRSHGTRTKEEEIALEVVIMDAFQRLPLNIRRRWLNSWFMKRYWGDPRSQDWSR